MNPFITGEADAYAKRNRNKETIEPWFIGLLQTIQFKSVVDLGCGDGSRTVAASPLGSIKTIGVEAASGNTDMDPYHTWIYGQDIETYDIPTCDLVMFSYILHWLPRANEVIERAMQKAKYILVNDFYPPYAIDTPYVHCEGVMTRKRRYGTICAEAGWVRHIDVRYPYKHEIGGESCACQIWRKP